MAPMRFVDLPADPRDMGPDRDPGSILGAHGPAFVSCVTMHVPGVTLRKTVYRSLHDAIPDMHDRNPGADGRRLCGVEHVEDIQLWQLPHTGRRQATAQARALERRHRRPVVLVHGWQHIGPCPDPETGARP